MPNKNSKARPTKLDRKQKYTSKEIKWLLWAFIYIGSKPSIIEKFKDVFKKSISMDKLHVIQRDEENQGILENIREKYDKDLHQEYLASKRSRLKEFTELYENAKDDEKWRDAAAILKSIDDLMNPKSIMGNINLLQLEQNNHYASMSLEEIQKQKLSLLEKLSHVTMNIEEDKKEPPTIEIKGTD